jgi:hypothetical protein
MDRAVCFFVKDTIGRKTSGKYYMNTEVLIYLEPTNTIYSRMF